MPAPVLLTWGSGPGGPGPSVLPALVATHPECWALWTGFSEGQTAASDVKLSRVDATSGNSEEETPGPKKHSSRFRSGKPQGYPPKTHSWVSLKRHGFLRRLTFAS